LEVLHLMKGLRASKTICKQQASLPRSRLRTCQSMPEVVRGEMIRTGLRREVQTCIDNTDGGGKAIKQKCIIADSNRVCLSLLICDAVQCLINM
jgi:hypothetical protein